MILYRYINRQLFATTVVVTFVLVMVLVSGRFIKYLADAAVGNLAADVLFQLMAFRLPEFLQMILPLSLYIGVLLVLGRMYVDNEIVVLRSGGISDSTLVRSMLPPVAVTCVVIALFSLYVTPKGDAEVARIFEEQQNRSVLELLTPGRFHVRGSDNGHQVTYTEGFNRSAGALSGVFLSDYRRGATEAEGAEVLAVWATEGKLVERYGMSYLALSDGYQYQGKPGEANFRKVHFEQALIRIGKEKQVARPPKVRSWSTADLYASEDNDAQAELQWRVSLVLLIPIMVLAAIPLARVNPRQGRFGKLIPAILVYMLYLGALLVTRSWISDAPQGQVPVWMHMGWVHLIAALLVALLYLWPGWRARQRYERGRRA